MVVDVELKNRIADRHIHNFTFTTKESGLKSCKHDNAALMVRAE